jgi:hypothetical protein
MRLHECAQYFAQYLMRSQLIADLDAIAKMVTSCTQPPSSEPAGIDIDCRAEHAHTLLSGAAAVRAIKHAH